MLTRGGNGSITRVHARGEYHLGFRREVRDSHQVVKEGEGSNS